MRESTLYDITMGLFIADVCVFLLLQAFLATSLSEWYHVPSSVLLTTSLILVGIGIIMMMLLPIVTSKKVSP